MFLEIIAFVPRPNIPQKIVCYPYPKMGPYNHEPLPTDKVAFLVSFELVSSGTGTDISISSAFASAGSKARDTVVALKKSKSRKPLDLFWGYYINTFSCCSGHACRRKMEHYQWFVAGTYTCIKLVSFYSRFLCCRQCAGFVSKLDERKCSRFSYLISYYKHKT